MRSRVSRFILLASFVVLSVTDCVEQDTTPPYVRVIWPDENDTCRATTIVRVVAIDASGVVAVELLVDGERQAVDSVGASDTFELSWNTRRYLPGSFHSLVALATDRAGNSATSTPVRVIVDPAAGTRHRGWIGQDETWRAQDSPHIVEGTLRVDAGLRLEPGVVVLFLAGAAIVVGSGAPGALQAVGVADSFIYFTSAETSPAPGDWRAIELRPLATLDTNKLVHCVIEWGGGAERGLVYCESSRVEVLNCSLRFSGSDGIILAGGRLGRFSGNAVVHCRGLPLCVDPAGVAYLNTAGNQLRGNGFDAIGVLGSVLADSVTWPVKDLPYLVISTLTIAGSRAPVLTVASGCTLFFADTARLRIGVGQSGGFRADGSERIVFGPSGSRWPGIEVWEHSIPYAVVLRNCVIDRAGFGAAAALFVYKSNILLARTVIRNSANIGIWCVDAGFTLFQDDTITGCVLCPLRIDAAKVASLGNGNYLAGNGSDRIEVVPTEIVLDAVWRNQGIPFSILGSIDVGSPLGAKLVIESGAELRFTENAALRVGRLNPGTLVAVGLPDSITMTAESGRPGGWRGVELHPLSGRSCTLDHCRLLNGGGGGPGILMVNACVPLIQFNEIAYSPNYCVALFSTPLDPDVLRRNNFLHDWNEEDYDDILYEPPR